ncbi:hypothetical protein NDU88_004145 [Pleurodeles waltl]|uniref:Uncharacterized protein n=1 Tax=Pleurodeles waltl TaxID=8319 RepID=A0AAV7RK68_PLEWA|nr:hypothetical protein NDU88_004145 [Pleurodeles waltl]
MHPVCGGRSNSLVLFAGEIGTSGPQNRGPTEVWNTQNGGLQLCDRPIKLHNRPVLLAGGSTCFKFRRTRVWDESSGRSHGCPPGASTGTGAARAGAHRRRLHWIEQGCEREVSASPARAGSPPRACGQSRRTRRGCGTDFLPL